MDYLIITIMLVFFLAVFIDITANAIDIIKTFLPNLFKQSKESIDKIYEDLYEELSLGYIKGKKNEGKKLLFFEKIGDTNSSTDEVVENLIKVLKENNIKIK